MSWAARLKGWVLRRRLQDFLEEQVVGDLAEDALVIDERGEEKVDVGDASGDGFAGEFDVVADAEGAGEKDDDRGGGVADEAPDGDEADGDETVEIMPQMPPIWKPTVLRIRMSASSRTTQRSSPPTGCTSSSVRRLRRASSKRARPMMRLRIKAPTRMMMTAGKAARRRGR